MAIQFSSSRGLTTGSNLIIILDPVVKPRGDAMNYLESRMHLLPLALILTLTILPLEAAQPDRYETLIHEIKCPVCDGQSIADSQALLAQDLRNYIKKEMALGKSDAEIKSFLQSRYGDAILLDTPFKAETALLWGVPLLFGFGLLTVFGMRFRRSRVQSL